MPRRPPPFTANHPVRLVTQRTGLSPHLLRMWERRYGVVKPTRSAGGQRLYTDQDIERLKLLAGASRAGRNIGQLVILDNETLRALIAADEALQLPRGDEPAREAASQAGRYFAKAVAQVESLEGAALEAVLRQAILALGGITAVDEVIVPLLTEMGDRWERGDLSPAWEHAATAVIRRVLDELRREVERGNRGPDVVIATPAGQPHEIGALLAATAAAQAGWTVTYLGAELPIGEIERAAQAAGSRAIGLSLVYPADDAFLTRELHVLARRLPANRRLILGGSAARSYSVGLEDKVELVGTLPELRERLGS